MRCLMSTAATSPWWSQPTLPRGGGFDGVPGIEPGLKSLCNGKDAIYIFSDIYIQLRRAGGVKWTDMDGPTDRFHPPFTKQIPLAFTDCRSLTHSRHAGEME